VVGGLDLDMGEPYEQTISALHAAAGQQPRPSERVIRPSVSSGRDTHKAGVVRVCVAVYSGDDWSRHGHCTVSGTRHCALIRKRSRN
jgi:hypothetical protein